MRVQTQPSPTLVPIAKIPLEVQPGGGVWGPELSFSPDGAVLYVRQPVSQLTLLDQFKWRAPEAGSVLLLAGLFWALWTIRRVSARPRRPGEAYCRKCNYELVPPAVEREEEVWWRWASESALCAECGRHAKLMIGRGKLWRLVLPLSGAVTLAICGGGLMRWSLMPHAPWGGTTWPVAGLESVVPTWAVDRAEPPGPRGHRVTRWSVPSGRSLGTLCNERVRGFRNGLLSPDGKMFAFVCEQPDPNNRVSLVLVDAETGSRREVAATGGATWGDLAGFSSDSRTLYVQWGSTGGTKFTTSLEAFNTSTLDRREVTRQGGTVTQLTQGNEVPFSRFLVDGDRWAFIVLSRMPGGSAAADLTCFDGTAEQKWSVPFTATSWYEPRLERQWTVVLPLYGTSTDVAIDLGSGASTVTPSPIPALCRTPDARRDVRPSPYGADVLDAGVLVASLGLGPRATFWASAISRDGRYVATTVTTLKPGARASSKLPTDFETAVYLWDLGR